MCQDVTLDTDYMAIKDLVVDINSRHFLNITWIFCRAALLWTQKTLGPYYNVSGPEKMLS